jgi:FlaA1/EpsC-like NDP-sugar epimerase
VTRLRFASFALSALPRSPTPTCKVRRITVLSRDEAKQHHMRLRLRHARAATDDVIYQDLESRLAFRIGDVRDEATMIDAVRGADVIVHAAAMKQVPTCEYFPMEAVRTNILGSNALVSAVKSAGAHVEAVVGLSTDKACKPVNVMGLTKALMERVLIEGNVDCPRTRFVCVRYGNVVASRGSVVPLFLDQVARGGPVTITRPDMTRFLVTREQAVDAVMSALVSGRRGEIYVPKMASARMIDLAYAIIDGRDIPVRHTGIRPGEKIHEVIVSEEECARTLVRGDYYVITPMLPECAPERPITPAPTMQAPTTQALATQALTTQALTREYSSEHVTLDQAGIRALLRRDRESRGRVLTAAVNTDTHRGATDGHR